MRRFVLFGLVVAIFVLLPHAMSVVQDRENVLLHEDFDCLVSLYATEI